MCDCALTVPVYVCTCVRVCMSHSSQWRRPDGAVPQVVRLHNYFAAPEAETSCDITPETQLMIQIDQQTSDLRTLNASNKTLSDQLKQTAAEKDQSDQVLDSFRPLCAVCCVLSLSTLSLCFLITCTCYDESKLKTKISHTHSLILSLFSACSSTLCSLLLPCWLLSPLLSVLSVLSALCCSCC